MDPSAGYLALCLIWPHTSMYFL